MVLIAISDEEEHIAGPVCRMLRFEPRPADLHFSPESSEAKPLNAAA